MTKLKWLEFKNHDTGVEIKHADLSRNISLFGRSSDFDGTDVLDALKVMRDMATVSVHRFPRISGEIAFTGADDKEYVWEVRTYHLGCFVSATTKIAYEKLTCNGNIVFERGCDKYIEGFKRVPDCPLEYSYMTVFRDEHKMIASARYALAGIRILGYYSNSMELFVSRSYFDGVLTCYQDWFPYQESLLVRVLYLHEKNRELWDKTLAEYISVFPGVKNINVEHLVIDSMDVVSISILAGGFVVSMQDAPDDMINVLGYLVDMMTAAANHIFLINKRDLDVEYVEPVWHIVQKYSARTQFIAAF